MKVKMVKMGMDIDKTRNHRIRGIVPTEDGKYLFVEIMQGRRPDKKNMLCSQKEYEKMYPYPEYIYFDSCFRVDIPEDYFKNYTQEFSDYDRKPLYEYAHTKDDIVKLLQRFNKDIDDIELTDENYIDKYCEEKGFFSLYDNRLKHDYKPIEVLWTDMEINGESKVKVLYTCYSANGIKYQEEQVRERDTHYFINEYGKETMEELMTKYIDDKSKIIKNVDTINLLKEDKNKLFDFYTEKEIDIEDSIDMDY